MKTLITANNRIALKKNGISEEADCIHLCETLNGELLIVLTDKELFMEELDNGLNEVDNYSELPFTHFWEAFEDIQCNSEMEYHEDIGVQGFGLTSAPGFTLGYGYNDSDEYTDEPHGNGRVWWFPNYMVEDFVETLLSEGQVIFHEMK